MLKIQLNKKYILRTLQIEECLYPVIDKRIHTICVSSTLYQVNDIAQSVSSARFPDHRPQCDIYSPSRYLDLVL